MSDIIRQYLEFLSGTENRAWLETDKFSVYVRKGRHLIGGELIHTLDVANVSNNFDVDTNEDRYHQGHFREFMQFVEEHNPYGVIYVEAVVSKRMEQILAKNGYVSSTHEHCYHKFVGSLKSGSTDAVKDLRVSV